MPIWTIDMGLTETENTLTLGRHLRTEDSFIHSTVVAITMPDQFY